MLKKLLKILGITLGVIIIAVFLYVSYIAHGITGYASKNIASGVFVSGRMQADLEKEDVSFFPVKFAKNHIDTVNKEVVSRFLFWKSRAVYNDGLGCTVVNEFPADKVRALRLPPTGFAIPDQDTIAWPAGNIVADSVPAGINIEKVNKLLDMVFADTGNFRGTFAVTVVYRDQLVAERYRSDIKPSTRLLSWSMAKSFTSAMTAMLVKEGKIDINKPMDMKMWAGDERKNLTLNNLLHMNSGLEFNEGYSTFKLTDVTTMLTKKGDFGDYAASMKLLYKPDSVWSYSSGTTNIIQDYLRQVIGNDEEYLLYPHKNLFRKIGMYSAVWEPDASGTYVGSSYLYATERDYARFGLLCLHNGNWMGEQLFPEDWIKYATTPAKGSDGDYGAQFWLNSSGEYPGVPADLFYCDGHDGQFIYIIPSKNLVVTRNGFSPGSMFDEKAFLKNIVEAIE